MPNDDSEKRELLDVSSVLPGNSRGGKKEEETRKPVEKVICGEATQRKKGIWKRVSASFSADNTQSVMEYVIHDVLIPAAKDLIVDTVRGALEMKMYGQRQGRSMHREGGRSTYTNYNSMSYRGRDIRPQPIEISREARARHEFDEVMIPTRGDAEQVLQGLWDLVERYGQASVADFYDLCGLDHSFTDAKWGWTNLQGSDVQRVRQGYVINLPRTVVID
jgi:hypothetical protein